MKKWLGICALVAAMVMEVGCSLNGPSGPTGNGGGGGPQGITISGTATKGPLNGASVTVYEVTDATGANGSSIGTATTDASGNFTVKTTKVPSGPIRVAVTGGTFLSDVDGKTSVTNSATLTVLVTDSSNVPNPLNVTLATSMLDTMAQGFAAGKTPGGQLAKRSRRMAAAASSCTGGVTSGMGCASSALGGYYGGVPAPGGSGFGGKPTVTSATDIDAFKIGLLSGAVEVCANKAYPSNPGAFFTAIFQDASDLTFDGKNAGADIFLDPPTNSVKLSSTALTTDFLICLNEYVSTSTVLSVFGSDLDSAVNSISGGVSQSPLTPKALGLAAGSSGAIATLAFQGKQYLFVAGRSSGVVVIDITDPTNASPTIKVWPGVNTALAGEVGGVIPIIGRADHGQVVAFAYGSKQMALLNADLMVNGDPTKSADETAIVDASFTPTLSDNIATVSGGSGYVLGGVPDPGRHGVWMATVDGYKLLDITLSPPDFDPSNSYDALPISGGNKYPSPSQVAENVGADIAHNLIFAGNYYGVQYVDLNGKKSWLLDPTNWMSLSNVRSSYTIDGDSVDGALGVGVLTFEDTGYAAFMNLNGLTFTPDPNGGPVGTFSPVTGGLVVQDLTYGGTVPYHEFSGSAVDGITHYGLLMAGYSTDMGVFQIQDPAAVASGASWTGLTNYSGYQLQNPTFTTNFGFTYESALDPHAVGAIFNIGSSKSYGYLLDGSYLHVLQIDLAGFLSATPDSTGHQPATDPTTAGTITHYDWTVPTVTDTKHGKAKQDTPVHHELNRMQRQKK